MHTCARLCFNLLFLCMVCLNIIALVGCGSGGGTYNPALIGLPVGTTSGTPDPTPTPTPTPSFDLAVAPPSVSVVQGNSAIYTLTLTAKNGFSASVTPGVTGLPAGAAATFQPAQITPTATGATILMTISTTGPNGTTPTPAGTGSLTVSATDGSNIHRSTVSLIVTAVPPGSLQGNIQ